MKPADLCRYDGRTAYVSHVDGDLAVILMHGCEPMLVSVRDLEVIPKGLAGRIDAELEYQRHVRGAAA